MFTITVGGILIADAVMKDLNNYLIEINEVGKLEEDHLQATERYRDFVKIHTLLKELMIKFQI